MINFNPRSDSSKFLTLINQLGALSSHSTFEYLAINEPRYEKTGFLHMRISAFVFRYTDSTIPLQPFSVAAQSDLCRTWLEYPKTGFLKTRLKWRHKISLEEMRSFFIIR